MAEKIDYDPLNDEVPFSAGFEDIEDDFEDSEELTSAQKMNNINDEVELDSILDRNEEESDVFDSQNTDSFYYSNTSIYDDFDDSEELENVKRCNNVNEDIEINSAFDYFDKGSEELPESSHIQSLPQNIIPHQSNQVAKNEYIQNRCPIFSNFLFIITNGDYDYIRLIFQVIGAIMAGDILYKHILFLLGQQYVTDTLLNVMKLLVGADFTNDLSVKEIVSRKKMAGLLNIKLNYCGPISDIRAKQIDTINMVASDILFSFKTGDNSIMQQLTVWLVFTGNINAKIPKTKTTYFERPIILPFKHNIPEEGQDKYILSKFKFELAEIKVLANEAYEEMAGNNCNFIDIGDTGNMDRYIADIYKEVKEVLEYDCIIDEDMTSFMPTRLFYQRYCSRCAESKTIPLSEQQIHEYLSGNLKEMGVTEGRTKKGLSSQMRGFWGIRLT